MAVLLSHNGYYLWLYLPSVPAAVIFIILFLVMAGLHSWRIWKANSKFCIPFALGCFFEFIGYCARALAYNKTDKLMQYIIQSLFILVAPALFAASIYMTLGRIMRSINGEHHSVLRINWVTKAFVIGDVLSFMVQGGSAGLMFNANTVKLGEGVVVGGLFIQAVSFGLFFVTAIVFNRRMNKFPTRASTNPENPWKRTLYMLYIVSVLILVRSIFRIVEYLQGQGRYSLKHEWTLYMFDSVLMFVVTVVFYLQYPSKLLAPLADDNESVDLTLQGHHFQPNKSAY